MGRDEMTNGKWKMENDKSPVFHPVLTIARLLDPGL